MSLEDLSPQDRAALNAGRALFANPEISKEAKRLLMKADPKAQFAEIVLEDALEKERKERLEMQTKFDNTIREGQIKHARERKHDELIAKGYDPIAIEKVMTDNKIADYDAAIRYHEATSQPAAPTPGGLSPMAMPDGKELWKNPIKWGRDEAFKAINELKAGRGRAA
jgi:hypothetical protein